MQARKLLLCGLVALACTGSAQGAEEALNLFDYTRGILEYYAGYCGTLGPKELEEAYILLAPNEYIAHSKDDTLRQADLAKVRAKLQRGIDTATGGKHAYDLLLSVQLGEYNAERGEFACSMGNGLSCMEYVPLKQGVDPASEEGRAQSVISRGLLFNKVHGIKLFFVNAEEFSVLRCPPAKAKRFMKSRTGADGALFSEIYALVRIKVLHGGEPEHRRRLEELRTAVNGQGGLESDYVMLAMITGVEAYADTRLTDKLGTVGMPGRKLELQPSAAGDLRKRPN